MKKLLSLTAAVALIAAAQLPARADDEQDKNILQRGAETTGGAIKKGAEATGSAIKKGAQETGQALGITDSDEELWEAHALGQHRLKGTVTSVDRDTGAVGFKTASGTLQLHFPTDELKGVEVGTPLTVMLAFAEPDRIDTREGKKPSEHRVAGDQPLRGEHWMRGTVTKVDAKSGMVGVQTTDDMPLLLHFSSGALATLKPGDEIAVQIAYEPTAATKEELNQ